MNDALNLFKLIKAALQTTHEITKLIKYSPHREHIFCELKDTHDMTTGKHSTGV